MRQLEMRHIRCVVTVAKHLHFSRAAEELEIAPPSLTKHIQEAERILEVRLFHRTKRHVSLTAAGEAFVADALTALGYLNRGTEHAQYAERGQLGRIAVGYVASALYAGTLQNSIRAFRAQHPRVEFDLRETSMDKAAKMLVDEELDVAYLRPPIPYPESIQFVTVHRDVFVLAVPSDSKLSAEKAIAPAQLREEQFVLPEQESGTLEVARRGRFSPNLGPRPGTLAAVLARVALGGNVAVVPRTLADCLTLPGVSYLPIAGKPIPSEIAIAFRRTERAPAVKAFLKAIRGQPLVEPAA
jgi:DNA-binding transcriptional LysR family regulator